MSARSAFESAPPRKRIGDTRLIAARISSPVRTRGSTAPVPGGSAWQFEQMPAYSVRPRAASCARDGALREQREDDEKPARAGFHAVERVPRARASGEPRRPLRRRRCA